MVRLSRPTRTCSGLDTQAWDMPATEWCTTAGAPRLMKVSRRLIAAVMNSRAHCSASGTTASVRCERGERWSGDRPSSSARTASLRRTPTATARCRDIETTGRAVSAASRAIKASIIGSSLTSPTTDGISGTRSCRDLSPRRSLISRAIAARSGWVQRGWSDQRSPARYEAISMKQAPLRALRCRPGDSVGMKSGMRVGFVMGPTPWPRDGTFPSVRLIPGKH